MDIVGAVVGIMSCFGASKPLQESVAEKCLYLRRPTRNLNQLERLMEELDAQKQDVTSKLNLMWLENGMEQNEGAKLWIKNVDQIKNEVSSLNDCHRQGLVCCYCCSRIRLGECIQNKIKDITDLLKQGQFSEDSIAEVLPNRGYKLPATPLMEYGTNLKTLMKIWEFLMDDRVRRIGVYGMGGVGKITIMTEINNRLLKESSRFNSVIWVTMTKDFSLEKLQQNISQKLGLDLSCTSDDTVKASKLLEALTRRKRFVLILDDLWEPFSLERIGIPLPTLENKYKLVITTRLPRTCRGMETDKDVEVKVLSRSEAWSLFKEKVGDQVLTSPALQSIAEDVAKECGGLPLALVTVGRALRNATDISEWENALAELKVSSTNVGRMEEEVFSCLKLSFTKLKDDTSRSCFLFCALYPEGHLIDTNELMAYWMWEGLLGGVDKMVHSRRKGRIILDELRYACLSENATENGLGYVKMHDLIRDMAIKIMNVDPHCIVKAGTRLTTPPYLDEWAEDVQRVSLMRNDLKSINFNPSCPGLTSLLLQYNSFTGVIKHNFFDNMLGLKILDLSCTWIQSLPESLSNLENLGALLLSRCWNLAEIPSLAKLIKLLVLDLSYSRRLNRLPHGMEQICSLRRLDLSCTGIEFLPSGIISKFTLLEELSTYCSGVLWVSKAVKAIKGGATIEELISSSNLCVLDINFWEVYSQYVKSGHWYQLNKYKFIVGQNLVKSSEQRSVTLCGRNNVKSEIALIPRNTMELRLDSCDHIRVLCRLFLDNVAHLKSCTIVSCRDMECIFDLVENNYSMLEILNLFNLQNLRNFCRNVTAPCPLRNLRIINVGFCPKLKSLIPRQLLAELKNLEEITICGCSEMEYLIEVEEGSTSSEGNNQPAEVIFPKLKRLKLYDLPVLKCMYDKVGVCNSLCSIEIWSCNALKRLPLGLFAIGRAQQQLCSPPALEEIKGTAEWWETLEWDQSNVKSFLQPYFVELDGDLISKIVASSRFSKYGKYNAPTGSSSNNVT